MSQEHYTKELDKAQKQLSKLVLACYVFLNSNGLKPSICDELIFDTVKDTLDQAKDLNYEDYK